jgi:hypothetical protein
MLSFRQSKSTTSANVHDHTASNFTPTFDNENRLRVLDADRFAQTEELERESRDFMAGTFVAVMRIETS